MKLLSTSLVVFLTAGMAYGNSISFDFNGKRIDDMSPASDSDKTSLIRRDQQIAWKVESPVAILLGTPDIKKTIKTRKITREMKALNVGNKLIQCIAVGPLNENESPRDFFRITVLRVEKVQKFGISFEVVDREIPSSKRLHCSFRSERNGELINTAAESALTVEELKQYITQNNFLMLREQHEHGLAMERLRENRKKRIEREAELEKQRLAGNLSALMPSNQSQNPLDIDSRLMRTLEDEASNPNSPTLRLIEAYKFPKSLEEYAKEEEKLNPQPKQPQVVKAPAPAASAASAPSPSASAPAQSKGQAEDVGF